ncbi:MAG: hypothetical protein HKP40_02830 [Litoreibacter sp.]|nr:hypothetical protein [Litoreibacter sp.]
MKRRRVFYIPGYDPIPPRRYRELYRTESAEQARISSYRIEITPNKASSDYGWTVRAEIENREVLSEISVLTWSDIVRDSMSGGILQTYLQLVRTAWVYISSGALWRLMRLRKGPVIAALFPVAALLVQLTCALAVFFGLWTAGIALLGEGAVTSALSALLGALAGVALLRLFKARDGRIFAYYLMHDFAFAARWRGANPPELEARIATFTEVIGQALHEEEIDEVLVVGHSSGAHLAVSALADVIRGEGVLAERPKLAFLSLGQAIPMMTFLPAAKRLRRDLHFLSGSDALTWIDVSAPGDGCAFALCDPVAVSGVAPPEKRWPVVVSAAFTQTLSPARWKALRWRFFRLHFQYLCAFDRPGSYDYFQITAGPVSLADRFAGRPPSGSRLETPLSGYRSME